MKDGMKGKELWEILKFDPESCYSSYVIEASHNAQQETS